MYIRILFINEYYWTKTTIKRHWTEIWSKMLKVMFPLKLHNVWIVDSDTLPLCICIYILVASLNGHARWHNSLVLQIAWILFTIDRCFLWTDIPISIGSCYIVRHKNNAKCKFVLKSIVCYKIFIQYLENNIV